MQKNWKRLGGDMNPTWEYKEEYEKTKGNPEVAIEGVFIEKKEDIGPNHSNVYTFEREDGSLIDVWGSGVLDTRFKNLKPGMEVRVVYLGKTKSEKTGRSYHNFDVFHNEEEDISGGSNEKTEEINTDDIPF